MWAMARIAYIWSTALSVRTVYIFQAAPGRNIALLHQTIRTELVWQFRIITSKRSNKYKNEHSHHSGSKTNRNHQTHLQLGPHQPRKDLFLYIVDYMCQWLRGCRHWINSSIHFLQEMSFGETQNLREGKGFAYTKFQISLWPIIEKINSLTVFFCYQRLTNTP